VLQSYCDTSYSSGGLNQMWILKNSKDLSEYIKSMSFSFCNTIKALDKSTLYTTISHSKLKDRLKELVQLCFLKKNDQRRYKCLVLGRNISYFVRKKKTLWFYQKFFWNWYHQHARVFGLTTYLLCLVDIPLGTNCAPLLADLFLYSYEANFIQGFSRKTKRR